MHLVNCIERKNLHDALVHDIVRYRSAVRVLADQVRGHLLPEHVCQQAREAHGADAIEHAPEAADLGDALVQVEHFDVGLGHRHVDIRRVLFERRVMIVGPAGLTVVGHRRRLKQQLCQYLILLAVRIILLENVLAHLGPEVLRVRVRIVKKVVVEDVLFAQGQELEQLLLRHHGQINYGLVEIVLRDEMLVPLLAQVHVEDVYVQERLKLLNIALLDFFSASLAAVALRLEAHIVVRVDIVVQVHVELRYKREIVAAVEAEVSVHRQVRDRVIVVLRLPLNVVGLEEI